MFSSKDVWIWKLFYFSARVGFFLLRTWVRWISLVRPTWPSPLTDYGKCRRAPASPGLIKGCKNIRAFMQRKVDCSHLENLNFPAVQLCPELHELLQKVCRVWILEMSLIYPNYGDKITSRACGVWSDRKWAASTPITSSTHLSLVASQGHQPITGCWIFSP